MITVFITYILDPFKLPLFEEYARRWLEIIPKCGGDLIGYYVPHEGANNIGYGLIRFESLAAYEEYRKVLKTDHEGSANFEFAMQEKFVLQESRLFLRQVELSG